MHHLCDPDFLQGPQSIFLVERAKRQQKLVGVGFCDQTGGVHDMLMVQVCAAHMVGFRAQNSLNKGPFSADFT